MGQKVVFCFVSHCKNIKIVNSVQVHAPRAPDGVNILSNEYRDQDIDISSCKCALTHLKYETVKKDKFVQFFCVNGVNGINGVNFFVLMVLMNSYKTPFMNLFYFAFMYDPFIGF